MRKIPVSRFWRQWLLASALCLASVWLFDTATGAYEQPLPLKTGASISWQSWRPFATDNTLFQMYFRQGGQGSKRERELGGRDENGQYAGESVVLRATVNGRPCRPCRLEAGAANSFTADSVGRPLHPQAVPLPSRPV